jgi:hypothetical protein
MGGVARHVDGRVEMLGSANSPDFDRFVADFGVSAVEDIVDLWVAVQERAVPAALDVLDALDASKMDASSCGAVA